MNRSELGRLLDGGAPGDVGQTQDAAIRLARQHGRDVFVTLAEEGLLGATPGGQASYWPALPVRGEIDIVGAGDSVTANLAAALAAGASVDEALELARAASSVVIHQLGTTGTASVRQITEVMAMPK